MEWERACQTGDLEGVIRLWTEDKEGLLDAEEGWQLACRAGQLPVAEWLWNTDQVVIDDQLFEDVCSVGHQNLAQWLVARLESPPWSSAWRSASLEGRWPITQWLWEQPQWSDESRYWWETELGTKEVVRALPTVWRIACEDGCLSMVQWLWALRHPGTGVRFLEVSGSGDRSRTALQHGLRYACQGDQLEIVQWLWSVSPPMTPDFLGWLAEAAYLGSGPELWQWLGARPEPRDPLALIPNQVQWAAEYATHRGRRDLIQRFLADGHLTPSALPDLMLTAGRRGHLELLQWLVAQTDGTLPDLSSAYSMMAEEGHLAALRWIVDHPRGAGAPAPHLWTEIYLRAATAGQLPVVQWLESRITFSAASRLEAWTRAVTSGHLRLAQWLWGSGDPLPWDSESLREAWYTACQHGHWRVAQWVWTLDTIDPGDLDRLWHEACVQERLELARWLWEVDPTRTPEQRGATWSAVCRRCRLPMVRWIWSLGSLDLHYGEEDAWIQACRHGRPEVVRWIWDLGGIDCQAQGNRAWREACDTGDHWLIQWLCPKMPTEVLLETLEEYPDLEPLLREWGRERAVKSARSVLG